MKRIRFEMPDGGEWHPPSKTYRVPKRVRYGRPLAGEYFLSGAIPRAYLARQPLETMYWIVKPTGAPLGVVETCPHCGEPVNPREYTA